MPTALINDDEIFRLREENKNLREQNDKLRIFKHDYCNVIASISGYIALNDMSGLKKFVESIINEINEVNQLQRIDVDTINEPSIYSLISVKYRYATFGNIQFNFFSNINYQKLNMDIYDFSKIIGILLDNAIEAAQNSIEKKIFMNAELDDNSNQIIKIKNSYSNKNVDLKTIFEKGVSSKKVKSGIGLWEVKEIITKHPNVTIYTQNDSDYFEQTLVLKGLS